MGILRSTWKLTTLQLCTEGRCVFFSLSILLLSTHCIPKFNNNGNSVLTRKKKINLFFWPLGSSATSCKNTTLTYYQFRKLICWTCWHTLIIYLELCFRPTDQYKSNTQSPFNSVFVLHQLLREISDSLAVKCSTMSTSWSLTLLVCGLVLSKAIKWRLGHAIWPHGSYGVLHRHMSIYVEGLQQTVLENKVSSGALWVRTAWQKFLGMLESVTDIQ